MPSWVFSSVPSIEVGEDNLVESLVKDAGDAKHEERPGIAEHTTPQLNVEAPAKSGQLLPEACEDHGGADEVYIEHHTHVHREVLVVESEGIEAKSWQYQEVEQVEDDVEDDVDKLQGSELERLLLITQISEGNALECVNGNADKHHRHP